MTPFHLRRRIGRQLSRTLVTLVGAWGARKTFMHARSVDFDVCPDCGGIQLDVEMPQNLLVTLHIGTGHVEDDDGGEELDPPETFDEWAESVLGEANERDPGRDRPVVPGTGPLNPPVAEA